MGEAFGVPVGWIAGGIAAAHLIVGYIKQLAPKLLDSNWYPVVAGVVSAGYAYVTLRPSWVAVAAGGLLIFGLQWLAWAGAKKVAIKAGQRAA
jgi:hypothetical protein